MGLTAPGEGERAIHEGWVERDGKLPVNVSGGLKAKGHPVGATGVSMHVMSAMQLSGTAPGALQLPKARIAVKAHRNGAKNPYAHFQKEFAYEFCRNPSDKNPFVAGPLKRTDCSPVTDGAAAVVLADVGTALGMKQAIAFRATSHVNDFLPMSKRDIIKFEGPALAWKKALASARLDLLDLSFVESHDCFTSAELIEYEAMGLTAPGEGERAIHEGWVERDGKLPVNVSGGLKAKGHPVGATGVSMHVMSAMQLSGTAPGDLQLGKATIGGLFNMGGAAVANYVSILEPLR